MRRKLSMADVEMIRRLRSPENGPPTTLKTLSEIYGVGLYAIWRAVHGISYQTGEKKHGKWKHLTGSEPNSGANGLGRLDVERAM